MTKERDVKGEKKANWVHIDILEVSICILTFGFLQLAFTLMCMQLFLFCLNCEKFYINQVFLWANKQWFNGKILL